MSTVKKPFGITAIAIYAAFSGLIYLLVAFMLLIASQAPGGSNLAMAGGVFICVLGVFLLSTVYGLWSLQEWGRVLSIWLSAISIILGVISIFPIWPQQQFTVSNAVFQLVGMGICGIIITYLSKQPIKRIFD